jgi:hypothetical protein
MRLLDPGTIAVCGEFSVSLRRGRFDSVFGCSPSGEVGHLGDLS